MHATSQSQEDGSRVQDPASVELDEEDVAHEAVGVKVDENAPEQDQTEILLGPEPFALQCLERPEQKGGIRGRCGAVRDEQGRGPEHRPVRARKYRVQFRGVAQARPDCKVVKVIHVIKAERSGKGPCQFPRTPPQRRQHQHG